MYYFKVMELYSLGSHQPSYGILASVLESNACTYVACVPDISCDTYLFMQAAKADVDAFAQKITMS